MPSVSEDCPLSGGGRGSLEADLPGTCKDGRVGRRPSSSKAGVKGAGLQREDTEEATEDQVGGGFPAGRGVSEGK